MVGLEGACVLVFGQHRGGDRDVGAAVKKVIGGAAETRRPSDGHGHEADGWTVALGDDGVDDSVSVSDGLRRVVGVEIGEIADEILVGDAELSGERFDEVIVVVKAAGQDESG